MSSGRLVPKGVEDPCPEPADGGRTGDPGATSSGHECCWRGSAAGRNRDNGGGVTGAADGGAGGGGGSSGASPRASPSFSECCCCRILRKTVIKGCRRH